MENKYNILHSREKGWFAIGRELLKEFKPKNELIKDEQFTIEDYLCETKMQIILINTQPINKDGYFSDESSKPYDDDNNDRGWTKMYESGYVSRHILNVAPLNKKCPIKTLTFEGNGSFLIGQTITATFDKSEFLYSRAGSFKHINSHFAFYKELPYKEIETAIIIKSSFGTYRSIHYNEIFTDTLFRAKEELE
jgi:hypothetical protein